jgi:prolipoprotein diacylglyceryl transferase
MFAFFFWDPKREIFVLPFLHYPILWYSLLFATGFFVGYFLLKRLLQRYFYHFPMYDKSEVDEVKMSDILLFPLGEKEKKFSLQFLFLLDKESKDSLERKKKLPLKKILDVLQFFWQKPALIEATNNVRAVLDETLSRAVLTVKKKAFLITDQFLVYMVIATIIGARIGHIFFYENPSWFLLHPFEIFKVWEGGLSSHGAAVAILIAVFLFSRLYLPKFSPKISFLSFMDLIVIPVSFAAVCIRIGNFFNQEILGTPSSFFFAVIFGHAIDGVSLVPRHPVQIYEALAYLITFGVLWVVSLKSLWKKGRLFGLFLLMVFIFRFFIEFVKVEQSVWIQGSFLTMGQYLSLPFILIGLLSLTFSYLRKDRV